MEEPQRWEPHRAVSERLCLPECNRETEFKAVSEQQLGRKKTVGKREQERERPAQDGATDGVKMKQGEKKRRGENVDSLKGAQGAKGKLGR